MRNTNQTFVNPISKGFRAILGRLVKPHRPRTSLVTFKGSGLLPGVDLDHSADLLTRMESQHHPL